MNYDYTYSSYQFLDLGNGLIKLFVGSSDDWRLNSGCTKIIIEGEYAYVHGESGSVYRIPVEARHLPAYAMSVLCNIMTKIGADKRYVCNLISLEEASTILEESK